MITQSTVFNTNGTIFEVLEPRLLLDAAPDYLIIAGHAFFDGQGNVCAAIQQLADWKQMKGFQSQVADMLSVGSDSTDVANFIKGGSADPNDPIWDTHPQYVLLVGDSSQVPTWQVDTLEYDPPEDPRPATHVSDNPYADILLYNGEPGSDNLPDLALGRIPVSTVADAATAINKILDYDRTPYVSQGETDNWYKNALVASYFEDGAIPAIEGSPDGKEDLYYFMETAHRVADFLGGDYDYWGDAGDPYDPNNVGYNVETALIASDPQQTDYTYYGDCYEPNAPSRGSPEPPPDPVPDAWLKYPDDSARWSACLSDLEAKIEADWEAGLGLVLYRDHGWNSGWLFGPYLEQTPVFQAEDLGSFELAAAVAGARPTPVVLNIGCLMGQFGLVDGTPAECMATGLLKDPLGAVGVVAATDYTKQGDTDTFTHGLYTAMWEDYDAEHESLPWPIWDDPNHTMRPAEAINYAVHYKWARASCLPNDFQWFGDPEMMLRTQAPRLLKVLVEAEETGVYVYASYADSEGFVALEQGRVCISMPGDPAKYWASDTLYGGAAFNITDLNNPNDPPAYEKLRGCRLVVSGFNAYPFQATILCGTPAAETMTVTVAATAEGHQALVNINDGQTQIQYAVALDATKQIYIAPPDGPDTLQVDLSACNPAASTGLSAAGAGTLRIVGGAGSDAVLLGSMGLRPDVLGAIRYAYVGSVDVELGDGADVLTVDLSGGNPLSESGALDFDGAAADTLLIRATAGDDSIRFGYYGYDYARGVAVDWCSPIFFAGTGSLVLDLAAGGDDAVYFDSYSPFFEDGVNITVSGGKCTLSADARQSTQQVSLTVEDGAHLTFATSLTLAALNLADTSTVILSDVGPAKTLVTGALSIAGGTNPTATLDLKNNALIIDYADSGPSPLIWVATWIGTGANLLSGFWDGNGIMSSTAAGDPDYLHAIGVIDNDYEGSPIYAEFGGLTIDTSSVLVLYTYFGDALLDGTVDGTDYSMIDTGYAAHLTGWMNGDFNYDGVVDGGDYSLIDTSYATLHPQGP